MVAGTLLVGSQLERKLPAVVPPVAPSVAPSTAPSVAPAFVCPAGTNPDKPGPVDQARPAGPPTTAFERRAGRLVAVTGNSNGVETWTFDVCRNTWTEMHPDREPSSFEWAQLVYDVDSNMTIGVSSGNVWAYDLEANTWTQKGVAPGDATIVAYDPVSGLLVAARFAARTELWNYDVETDTWTPIHQVNGPAYVQAFAYDASVDRIIAYTQAQTWLFDIRTGTWSRSGAVTPEIWSGMAAPNIVYDEAAERTVVFGNGRLATYDATADRWEILIGRGPGRSFEELPLCMVDDPVNGRLVGCGYPEDAVGYQADVIQAFDVATRLWTVLLEPAPSFAFACPLGSTPDKPGQVDQERPARNASAAIAFDRRAGRIVLLAPSAGAAAETWTFDVCSNVYARMRPAREPVLFEASHLVYDGDSGVTIATDGRTTWAYDLEANTWTEMGGPPAAADPAAPSMAYDWVSGLVIAAFGRELWSYDVGTDLWTLVSGAPWPDLAVLAYDASVNRIVADAGSETWLYDIGRGTWSRGTDPTFCAWGMAMMVPDVIVYDEAAKRTVVSCGTRAAYDATEGRWEFMADIPGSFPSSMAFDIVNERLVGIGEIQDGVFAFDPETREQIILLEPVRGQATP